MFRSGKQRKERLLRRLATPGGCFDKTTCQSPFEGSRGTWRSRLFRAGRTKKERLLRRLAMTKTPVITRYVAISGFRLGRTRKERLLRRLAMTDSCVVILLSRGTKRSRLSSFTVSASDILSSRGTKRSRLSSAGKQRKARLLRRLAMTRLFARHSH